MRVKDYARATKSASDDYFVIDGDSNGTRSLPASSKSDKSTHIAVTLNPSDWIEHTDNDDTYYTQEINVPGATDTNNIEIFLPGTADKEQVTVCQKAQICTGTQSTDIVTLYCWGTKPSINLNIECIVRGD